MHFLGLPLQSNPLIKPVAARCHSAVSNKHGSSTDHYLLQRKLLQVLSTSSRMDNVLSYFDLVETETRTVII